MRNTNELIGILKGISFDGVINDREVEHLQNWINKNRNLAYEGKQTELINAIDNILVGRTIDNDKRQLLIQQAESISGDVQNTLGKIYELHGIIEGVICDGEVNKTEIYRLREWLDQNKDFIQGYQLGEDLCAVVKNILEDDVVTTEEQQHLLKMLTAEIGKAKFETKLNCLCKLVEERRNIGIELIDILDNESAMVEIHKRAEQQFFSVLSSCSNICLEMEIVVVSLTLIALLEYDGNFYKNARNTYKKLYSSFSQQKIEGLIRTVLSKYKKQNNSGSRTRIINVALENAIVPQAFLSAFFELIFDIYKKNFDYDVPPDPYEDFQFVFEGLRENMLSDGDEISVHATQKTYKLIAATKQLILQEEGLDAVIKLSIIVLNLIDKRYWHKAVEIFNPYIKQGYISWEKLLIQSGSDSNATGAKRNNYGIRSRWEPKFMMKDDTIYLVPPTHRIKVQYDYKKLALVVLNSGEEIYRNCNCFVSEIIGGYEIKPDSILITNPLGRLTYRLMCGDEIIYDSKEILYRECIVFNQEGQELSNNIDFEGTVFICYKAGDADISNVVCKEFYCIGYKLVRVGDVISVGHKVLNFSSMVQSGVFGRLHERCFLRRNGIDEYIRVYKDANILVFEADNISTKFEIVINGKRFKLSEIGYSSSLRGGATKYEVELDLKNSGVYVIVVNQITAGKKKLILNVIFALDKSLAFRVERLEDAQYRVFVQSDIMCRNINTQIDINEFDMDFISFIYRNIEYSYLLPLDFGCYSLNDGEWHTTDDDLWIDDITLDTTMKLYDSKCDGLLVYTETGALAEDNISIRDRGIYKEISVGFLHSYKHANKYIKLVFMVGDKKRHVMLCYNKCVIDEGATEINFSEKIRQVKVTPVFHGKNRVFFEVFDKKGGRVYVSKALQSGQTEAITTLSTFEEYIFNFHEKTKMLMLRRNTLLCCINRTFYAKKDFVGKIFKIDIAYFEQFCRGEYIEKEYHFNKAYIRILECKGDGLYQGEIFVRTTNGEWGLDKINPVEVEICSDIIDDTMDLYMTNCGDGLLLDFSKHGILNAMEHPTAPDIFLYTVNMKGE